MKQPIILFFFVGIFLLPTTLGASCYVHQHTWPMSDASKTIDLNGKFKIGDLRSGTDPIVIQQIGRTLFINFQSDIRIVNVTIQGPQGVVYASSVDTSNPFTLTVPLDGCSSGNYTISFTNEYGAMQGSFTL